MIFHAIDFSASQVGSGLAVSALIGTAVRLFSGSLLDRGLRCSWPVRGTTLLAVLADLTLFQADTYGGYLLGQLLLGTAAGLYWPAIELAVPLCCGSPSGRGYALVRSADALGIGLGALLGSVAAFVGQLRLVYGVEAFCMTAVLILISIHPLEDSRTRPGKDSARQTERAPQSSGLRWLGPLLPVLAVSVIATGILALQQSALPLDLVNGGLQRPALSESQSSGLIALQLSLLVILQWPVGRWLSDRSVMFGLSVSVAGFSVGSVLLALSSLSEHGLHFVLAALMPMALAQAAFLPTATEAVIEETPPGHRGLAMALFSQCFAISAMAAPLIGGALLDRQGHGLLLWLLTAAACLLILPVVRSIQPRFTDSSEALKETVDGVTGNPGFLGD